MLVELLAISFLGVRDPGPDTWEFNDDAFQPAAVETPSGDISHGYVMCGILVKMCRTRLLEDALRMLQGGSDGR